MSINRDMESYTLQINNQIQTDSGAKKDNWIDRRKIDVAVYKKNETKTYASEVYLQSSHTGLTYCKDISSKNCRLVRDGVIYNIEDCNTSGRMTNLLLKAVE